MTTDRPQRPRTFRARLTLSMALLTLGVLGLAGVAIYLGVRQSLQVSLDRTLLSIVRTEVASALDRPGSRVHVHEEAPLPLTLRIGAGYEKLAQIENARDQVVAQTANLREGPGLRTDAVQEAQGRAGQVTYANLRRAGHWYRAIYYPFHDRDGSPLLAIVALPKLPMEQTLQQLLGVLALVLLVGSGLAAWGASHQAGRLTQPLEAVAQAARAVGGMDLSARIPDIAQDVELRDVTAVVNDMLARLEAAFASQRQLIAAQQRFVADASHELRSPLHNMRGTVEVALRRPRSSEDYREVLETTGAEIRRMCRLVEELLTLTRADAGQFPIDRAPCDMAQIAHQAAAAHTAAAGAAGVQLLLDSGAPVMVDGDRDRLRQVLDNLLDNALRYAPAGTAVTITAQQDGRDARLSVQDQGPGLSAEDQQRVFDRFYRADRSRSRQSGGLGLGLAIAQAIVGAHQGKIGVQSEPGRGTVFVVHLPAALPAGALAPEKRQPVGATG